MPEQKYLKVTRRRLFAAALVGGGAAATIGGAALLSRPEKFMLAMTRRALPQVPFAANALEEAVRDYVGLLTGSRRDNLDRLTMLAGVIGASGVEALVGGVDKYRVFRRTSVTQLLLRTDYFSASRLPNEPVQFVGAFACGLNPFARFDPD